MQEQVHEMSPVEIERAMKRAALEATEEIKGHRVRMSNPKAERNRRKAQRRTQKKARRANR